jgi:hypothetical protein
VLTPTDIPNAQPIEPSSPTQSLASSRTNTISFSSQQVEPMVLANEDPPPPRHAIQTRSRNNIFKPKMLPDGLIRYPLPKALLTAAYSDEIEPTSYSTVAQHLAWRATMNTEFDALFNNGTWTLVPTTSNMNIVGCKWVFCLKRKADGTIDRYKARLVAKGFHQQPVLDFGDTYSPVVKPTTIRLVLSLAISSGWLVRQIDVQNAFLHGWLSKDVYMAQPLGFLHPQFLNHICKLHKALYGLKQAPRAWYSHLSDRLLEIGFVSSRFDSSLFIHHTPQHITYVFIYVDILITSFLPYGTTTLLQSLQVEFAIKDLGPLYFFLGMEAIPTSERLILSQQRNILDLLRKSNMSDAKPIKTPMSTAHSLSLFSGDPFSDPSSYCSLVGGLQYLSLTRPDISFAVNKVSQFMHRPTSLHLQAVKRILRYLKSTISYGLLIRRSPSRHFQAFSDADWAGCSDDRKSMEGFASFLAPTLSLGPLVNNELLPAPTQNLNTAPLPSLQLNLSGFNLSCVISTFLFPLHLFDSQSHLPCPH